MVYWNFPCVSLFRPRFLHAFFGSHRGFLNNFPRACQKMQLRNIVLAPSSRKTRKRSGCLELPKVARNRHFWSIRSCQGHVHVHKRREGMMKFLHFRKLSRPWIFIKYKTLCLVGGHPSIFLGDELMELGNPWFGANFVNLKVGEMLSPKSLAKKLTSGPFRWKFVCLRLFFWEF